ncbi:MAG: ketopantoate reductase family protein [Acidobacteriaceae bacterium]|jgi:2-dehydropantoate 2-reductase
MKILVIGAGAVGGYFGGRLAQAGRDVTFLVRGRQADNIRKQGLQIVSPHGDATLHPRILLANELRDAFDLILLSVKGYGLEPAINDFAPAVGKATMILPVLNGMRHIDLLIERFGEGVVIGGVCLISSEVDDDGRIVQLTGTQRLVYGELRGGPTERMNHLDTVMQGAGFEARISEGITQEMWQKWVQLSSLGALTCLLRGAVGEAEAVPGGVDTATEILRESTAIATACGHPPSGDFLGKVRSTLTTRGSNLTSSMYRDLVKGTRVEADQIIGDLLDRGRRFGVDTPLLHAAYVNLKIYEGRLSTKD